MKQTKSLFCLIMWMLWAFPALAQDAIPSNNSGVADWSWDR